MELVTERREDIGACGMLLRDSGPRTVLGHGRVLFDEGGAERYRDLLLLSHASDDGEIALAAGIAVGVSRDHVHMLGRSVTSVTG